ncbi:unnamed protein product [Blepharisma stoltei]|uniref:Uncharacterized protein n=1 Tax=Blepharisma stoltei TaxID=1481888 RepID=A0AAU9KKH0_9CILI|nr:unnamed protein product [Blepharisma stoltei]
MSEHLNMGQASNAKAPEDEGNQQEIRIEGENINNPLPPEQGIESSQFKEEGSNNKLADQKENPSIEQENAVKEEENIKDKAINENKESNEIETQNENKKIEDLQENPKISQKNSENKLTESVSKESKIEISQNHIRQNSQKEESSISSSKFKKGANITSNNSISQITEKENSKSHSKLQENSNLSTKALQKSSISREKKSSNTSERYPSPTQSDSPTPSSRSRKSRYQKTSDMIDSDIWPSESTSKNQDFSNIEAEFEYRSIIRDLEGKLKQYEDIFKKQNLELEKMRNQMQGKDKEISELKAKLGIKVPKPFEKTFSTPQLPNDEEERFWENARDPYYSEPKRLDEVTSLKDLWIINMDRRESTVSSRSEKRKNSGVKANALTKPHFALQTVASQSKAQDPKTSKGLFSLVSPKYQQKV